ncbi:hypothetical protein FRB99_002681 [Tulasnella sp. 403]|nr:hypothetical protein FRB99_002681 [Tulasnella sp. 403]
MPPIPSSTLPAKLLPNLLPSAPVLKRSGSLYQVLSVLPKDGIGARVAQSRWENKGIKDTYWEVTRVRLKDEGKHGKAWGKLVWKATVGDVQGTRPAIWDVLGRAKWDAWEKQRGLDPQQAKWLYVQTLQKVLRRYSDRTVARDLVRELDSYGTDPSHLVMSESLMHTSGEDSASSRSSSPLPAVVRRQTMLQEGPAPGYPPDISEPPMYDSPEEQDEKDSDDEEHHDVVRPNITSPAAASMSIRPQSSMSSQIRYRTPMSTSTALPPVPATSAPPVASTQPLPRFATPSAFAQNTGSVPPAPPSTVSYPTSMSYVQPPTVTASTGGYYVGSPVRRPTLTQTPVQRTPLERAVEGMQASLAALHERMDTIEANIQGRASPSGLHLSDTRGGYSSPLRAVSQYFPPVPFDPNQTGAWSIVLSPLSRMLAKMRELLIFLAYPPDPATTTARLIIIRRLVLDASFTMFVISTLRRMWRVTGIRRREVVMALIGVWHALMGTRTRVLVDKAVGQG